MAETRADILYTKLHPDETKSGKEADFTQVGEVAKGYIRKSKAYITEI